jgi:hypothetical protein
MPQAKGSLVLVRSVRVARSHKRLGSVDGNRRLEGSHLKTQRVRVCDAWWFASVSGDGGGGGEEVMAAVLSDAWNGVKQQRNQKEMGFLHPYSSLC